MPKSLFTRGPSQVLVERLPCPKCLTRMSLVRIAPARKGFDLRTFECPKCSQVQTITVAVDPLKSAAGWISSDLKSPD